MNKQTKRPGQTVYGGIGISGGSAMGRLYFFDRAEKGEQHRSTSPQREEEWERLQKALLTAAEEISAVQDRVLSTIGEEEARIFEIHRMLIEDEDFLDALREEAEREVFAEEAVERATARFCGMLEELEDPYLSARAADLRDVGARLCRILSGGKEAGERESDEAYILVARDLTPSQTVTLDQSRILGFVTFGGTPSSHTAILARAMGIPALIGTGEIPRSCDGKIAILDAASGSLLLEPDGEQCRLFTEERQRQDRIAKDHERYLRSLMNKPAVTRSGHRMMIYANIGDGEEVASALAAGADGIGLLRSEFLYLQAKDYPREEELFEAYRRVAIQMGGKRAIIRTLDVGADKRIPYFGLPEEENPALGFRAIRICLARQELFKTQLRAILRASAYGRLSLMLPMVISVEEVRQSRQLLEECMHELQLRREDYDAKIEFGIMIETPAAAVMSRELAAEVDFFSVGTNDLIQYTLAADRQNPALTELCRDNTEPVLRLIQSAADAIHQSGGWIGICGELAADLNLTQRFVNMRIDELSVSVPYLLGVRGRVCECL